MFAGYMETVEFQEIDVEVEKRNQCFHCGEDCPDRTILFDEKYFCCNGCLTVYQLLHLSGLCNYYDLNPNAGINQRKVARQGKYDFLDDAKVCNELIGPRESGQARVTFYIPNIHCSSCIYLLENLHVVCPGVVRIDVQFLKKEIAIVYNEPETTLRKIVEVLDRIGYEPFINLNHSAKNEKPRKNRSLIYRLGVAGFCFGNIMLFSIPEYFSSRAASEPYLESLFRYLNVIFSLPVFFYSAAPFFTSAFKGIRQRHLNIDVPVSLAIAATFTRSMTDVFLHDGGGFFDAMSGIVFFMLAGRVLQERTQQYLFFDRDYKDYFPMAVMTVDNNKNQKVKLLAELNVDDHLLVHNNELVPADSLLIKGKCLIDYSFVTGESQPVEKKPGELIYAGGRQLAGVAELRVVKTTDASHLMKLWSRELDEEHEKKLDTKNSFVHILARNFTIIVLVIAAASAFYWWQFDASRIWPAVTSILIIACPCGLLLTSTFTNGHVLNLLSKNGFHLRNASIIERVGSIKKIVFDKTGTLTSPECMKAFYMGSVLSEDEKEVLASVIRPSLHSFKNSVIALLGAEGNYEVRDFREVPGLGIEGAINGSMYKMGIASYFDREHNQNEAGTQIHIYKDEKEIGYFLLTQSLRPGLQNMFERLKRNISFFLLSGDEPHQQHFFRKIFGDNMLFRLSPVEKLSQIGALMFSNQPVAMVGDGLNDAGALKKSNVGICITDDISRFTPAGDAILDGSKLSILDRFIQFCKSSKNTIRICFFISVIYNITGLFFAVQGTLSPLIAAILMPLSTLTIVVTTYVACNIKAKRLGMET